MNEIRSFASLSGSLLARKGGAKPAMRPRPLSNANMLDDLGWDDMGDVDDSPPEHVPSSIAGLTPAPKPAPLREEARRAAAEEVPVRVQQRALSERFGEAEAAEQTNIPPAAVAALRAPVEFEQEPEQEQPRPTRITAVGKKAAFTLRLDPDRHLRLRLAVAVTGRSAQVLVTQALDEFLANLPEIGSLAQQLPARAGSHS